MSGRLGYAAHGIDVSAIYAETTVVLNDKFKQWLVGAAYDFGVAKVSGEVIQARYDSTAGGRRKQMVYQIGASVPIGDQVFRADYIDGNMSGGAPGSGFGDADDASQFALGYQYNLSKRTALYTTAAILRNRGASKLIIAPGNSGMRPGEDSKGINAGLRHSF